MEEMVLPSLKRGGYTVEKGQNIGLRPTGRKHIIDLVANKENKTVFISLK